MEHAKPGDIIEVTYNDPYWVGKQFVVVPCPKELFYIDKPGYAWFLDKGGQVVFFEPSRYKITKRISSNNSVDEFLKRQLNDNLGSVFA